MSGFSRIFFFSFFYLKSANLPVFVHFLGGVVSLMGLAEPKTSGSHPIRLPPTFLPPRNHPSHLGPELEHPSGFTAGLMAANKKVCIAARLVTNMRFWGRQRFLVAEINSPAPLATEMHSAASQTGAWRLSVGFLKFRTGFGLAPPGKKRPAGFHQQRDSYSY